jgi:hypothetical protein
LAKGTATRLGSDFDLFISLTSNLTTSLKDIYDGLGKALAEKGLAPRRQNVSWGIVLDNLNIDVTPGKQQSGYVNYHSIYLSKKGTWTQTNVKMHIDTVKNSGRLNEIRILKIWSKLHGLDFPSFYLELAVIEALRGRSTEELDTNFQRVLSYLVSDFPAKTFQDPANSANLISDSLNDAERAVISHKAKEGYDAPNWSGVIW